jgi:N-acetylglucosamine kinase-like BadF-type ATPase
LPGRELYGGVDGGATKTWALVGDETGCLLGFGAAGSANYHIVGLEATLRSVIAALEAATAEAVGAPAIGAPAAGASLLSANLARAGFYLAGDDSREDHSAIGEALGRTLPGGLAHQWDNDCWAALRGGAERNWGAVCIGGSGTNSAAVGPDGRRAILRGLGWESGNPGGSSEIARQAVIQAFRMDEGARPKTRLHGAILEALGLPDYDALVREHAENGLAFAYRAMGVVTPLVFRLAGESDPAAQDVLVEMGRSMGEQTGAVMVRAGIQAEEAEVVLAGSVYRGRSPLLIDSLTLSLHRFAPGARPRLPRYHPVVGAYLLALEEAGRTTGPATYANLDRTVARLLPRPTPDLPDETDR